MKKFNVIIRPPVPRIDFDGWVGFKLLRFDPPRYGGLDWVLCLGFLEIRHWRELTDDDYEKLGIKRMTDEQRKKFGPKQAQQLDAVRKLAELGKDMTPEEMEKFEKAVERK